MSYLIKFIFFLLICHNINANEKKVNEVLFKINNKFFTNIDLEKRTEYIALINNLNSSKFSDVENNQILDDYISSLIFYEYYIKNKKIYKNLNNEIDSIFINKIDDKETFDKKNIKNYKFNIEIDLIRKKIIEEYLNSKEDSLLQEANKLDLLYNYNTRYIIIKEELLDKKLIENINNRNDFDNLKIILNKNNIDFFYKEEDINNNSLISNKVMKIIEKDLSIFMNIENGYINLISIVKNLESYEGIFVKLINFTTNQPVEKKDLQCNNINKTIYENQTIYKEYEYSKLNNKIKENLKSINDFILFKDNNNFNYIILCDLKYDEKILKNINFNKNVNSLVNKIQNNFLKKYKNEFNFIKTK